ncbi:hypothetical protein N0V92_011654 [Colletotrichum tropicale]|nr:hypothetical protein N0V92_011654 [Colletotrichum tropicale]
MVVGGDGTDLQASKAASNKAGLKEEGIEKARWDEMKTMSSSQELRDESKSTKWLAFNGTDHDSGMLLALDIKEGGVNHDDGNQQIADADEVMCSVTESTSMGKREDYKRQHRKDDVIRTRHYTTQTEKLPEDETRRMERQASGGT